MELTNAQEKNLQGAMQRFTFERFDKTKDSWDDYIFAFEQMLRAKGLYTVDHQDYAAARRTLLLANVGLEPLKIVRNHFRPADVNDQTYGNIKGALKGYYMPSITVFSARIDFMKRNRLDNETIGQYANALRELADAADYSAEVSDFILRDRFAAGVRHEKTEIELRQKWPNGKDGDNDVTFEQVFRLADTIARAELECNTKGSTDGKGIENGSSKAPDGDASVKKVRSRRYKSEAAGAEAANDICESCGHRKHRKERHCPARDEECDNCGETGHFARMCPERPDKRGEGSKKEEKKARTKTIRMRSDSSSTSEDSSDSDE
jgi:hypothetical protein